MTEYLENLELNYNRDVPWSFRSRNFQSFEMGLDETLTDADLIEKTIQGIEFKTVYCHFYVHK